MNLDELWVELEGRLPHGVAGRQQQRIHPEAAADLHVAVVSPGRRRSLTLEVASEAVDHLDELPSARGVATQLLRGTPNGRATLEVELTDPTASDLFSALAADVAAAVAAAPDDGAAVRAFVGRLSRWIRLLQRAVRGLSSERQRGLYAELWFLREKLAPALGIDAAVSSWEGPTGAPHDFQTAAGSFEVKSTATNQPQVVRVTSERQLDETGTPALHLIHVSLDVHRDAGETLPQVAAAVRGLAAGTPAEGRLQDRLLDSGYVDADDDLYRHTGYTIREQHTLQVTDGFPRIVETALPPGVGNVAYSLAIPACLDFKVDDEAAFGHLRRRSGS